MIEVRSLTRDEIPRWLDELATLRLAIFRTWPYLYEGDLDYERGYLHPYQQSDDALVIAALHDDRLIGFSTAIPLEEQSAEFTAPFAGRPEPLDSVLYGGELMLLPFYRGRGLGDRFFDLREKKAESLGRAHIAFCSIARPENHPLRPPGPRTAEAFWTRRGYRPLPGVVAELDWRDRGDTEDTSHMLQFWMRTLP